MRKIKISTRLLLGFGATIILMLAIAITGIWRMTETYQTNSYVQQRQSITNLLTTLAGQVEVNANQAYTLARLIDPLDIEFMNTKMAETQELIDRLYIELNDQMFLDEALAMMASVQEKRQEYIERRVEALKHARAGSMALSNQFFMQEMPVLLEAYTSELHKLADFQNERLAAAVKASNDGIELGRGLIVILGLLALIIGLLTAWRITRSITHPLNAAVDLADAVARRDLSMSIRPQGNDEVTRLETALQNMITGLQDAMSQVRTGSEAIATAAAQVSMGNLDLSSRTEQQSSSLAETASAMEEMTTTVRQNDDNARQASSLSANSTDIARAGSTAVQHLAETMSDINNKSRQIAAIVDVIDGIAFQTNILALNAAVEAARAGDQGRGFAVVAGEVRALAQRSANAAREIKELIDTSVATIANGNQQATEAESGMQEVLQSIQQVTDLLEEISTASNEQTIGIEQINQAIMQMDDATRQNASLVEESVAAADNMDQQARTLADLVASFRLRTQETIVKIDMTNSASTGSSGQTATPPPQISSGLALRIGPPVT